MVHRPIQDEKRGEAGQTARPRSALRLGSTDGPGADGSVAQLQAALRRLQVLSPDQAVTAGCFDEPTESAVRRFQWFAGHVPGALAADGAFVARTPVRLIVDGVAGQRTQALIQAFAANDWAATGLLTRFSFDLLSHAVPNAGFRALLDGNPAVGVCEQGFAELLRAMNAAARRFGVRLFVNELFRVDSVAASTQLKPASFSAHRVGRAVDLQLGLCTGTQAPSHAEAASLIMTAAPGTAFARFRQHAKKVLRCRYGGDFDPADPPHFDRQVLPSGSDRWQMHYFFNQLQYRQALLHPGAVPEVAWDSTGEPRP